MKIDDYTKEVFLILIKKPLECHYLQGKYARIVARKLCAHNYIIARGERYQITTFGINYVRKFLPEIYGQINRSE